MQAREAFEQCCWRLLLATYTLKMPPLPLLSGRVCRQNAPGTVIYDASTPRVSQSRSVSRCLYSRVSLRVWSPVARLVSGLYLGSPPGRRCAGCCCCCCWRAAVIDWCTTATSQFIIIIIIIGTAAASSPDVIGAPPCRPDTIVMLEHDTGHPYTRRRRAVFFTSAADCRLGMRAHTYTRVNDKRRLNA